MVYLWRYSCYFNPLMRCGADRRHDMPSDHCIRCHHCFYAIINHWSLSSSTTSLKSVFGRVIGCMFAFDRNTWNLYHIQFGSKITTNSLNIFWLWFISILSGETESDLLDGTWLHLASLGSLPIFKYLLWRNIRLILASCHMFESKQERAFTSLKW